MAKIENVSHEFIPIESRNNSAREMFFTWFSANTVSTTLVTGALAIIIGLDFFWSCIAIIVGHGLGAIIMALHAALGPKSGLPQVVQSRAQFGYYGAILPMIIIFIMYIGYGSTNIVVVGQGLKETLNWNLHLTVIFSLIPMVIIAIYGQSILQKSMKVITYVYIVTFIALTFLLVTNLEGAILKTGNFNLSAFILMTSICVTWQITYGPYVADHTRFISPKESVNTFKYTYAGTFLSSAWLMVLGALSATMVTDGNVMGQIKSMGTTGWIITLLLTVGVLVINSLNIYGAGIILLSIISNFISFKTTARLRIFATMFIGMIMAVIATFGAGNFMANFQMYLVFVLFFIIPWSSITLIDFFVLKRNTYHHSEYEKKDGIFRPFNKVTLSIYLVTIVIQIPFLNTDLYVGTMATMLNGVDIAWVVGLIFSSVVYYTITKMNAINIPSESNATINELDTSID
ncbi:cytosine permease [Lysinibacillus sp. KU-BSD001]|uniref:purine-cytosine permease family protein n=1 Tax=Lysinibacillus sp. KU-BSD001 TaxID=3141328 RepID=UPI0036E84D7C